MVRISKYRNIFAKGHVLNEKKSFKCFMKKNCKKQIKKSLELKK